MPLNRTEDLVTAHHLTDPQRVLLSAASQRDDGLLVQPDRLKGGAARMVVEKIIAAGPETLEADIAALSSASLQDLRAHWERLYGQLPPKSLRRDLLIRAVAYQMQVKVYGGLSLAMKRQLREVALAVREGRFETAVPKSRIAAGTRLIRLWQGQTHTVYVHGDGFEWNGSRYRSLSTIAKAITGTNWNGWTFFGVKRGKAGDGRDELGRFRSGADAEGMRDWPRTR
jgi:hypothetical protein